MKAEPGIRPTKSGWQAYVRIDGEFRSKHFPRDTSILELRRWREQQKARKVLNLPPDPDAATFAKDARTYLAVVTGLTSYAGRKQHLEQWIVRFGSVHRDAISPVEIRAALEHWRKSKPYAPATLNLLRTALMHFYSVTNGKAGKNPVKEVPRYHEAPKRWTLPTWEDARSAVTASPNPKFRLRLTILRLTGWPSAQLKRLEPSDVHKTKAEVRLSGRRKGKGTRDAILPVLPQAHEALRQLVGDKLTGPFFNSEMHRNLMRGCRDAEVAPFRVYDLRHRFLTTAALAIRDDAVIQALALHASKSMTARYIEQAVDPRVRDGLQALALYLRTHHGEP